MTLQAVGGGAIATLQSIQKVAWRDQASQAVVSPALTHFFAYLLTFYMFKTLVD
jgi:hypothetical protein